MSEKRVADMTRSELRGTIQSAVMISLFGMGVLYVAVWVGLKFAFGI